MVANPRCDLKKAYFNYLVERVCDKQHDKVDYIPLLDLLHSMKFVVVLDMDENRVGDGAYIRKKWLQEEDLYDYLFEFEDEKVSVLEVLVGIAERFEYQVGDMMVGDRTNERFWELLRNLDIEKYTADNYKPLNIKEKVRIWMNRKYKKDGSGSIFPVKKHVKNMLDLQIWDQMTEYIMENYC